MAPPRNKNEGNGVSWWQKEDAYLALDNIYVQYELEFGKDLIKAGDLIKIKNQRTTYRFRCLAHNISLEKTWIDCMDVGTGAWFSFRPEKIKCLVKPKKSRRKKVNA